MTPNNLHKHGALPALLAGLVLAAMALWLRHGVLEAGLLPRDCAEPGALCLFKTVLVESFLHQRVGWLSLGCGLLGFVLGARSLAWVGWLSGVAGLVLYSYDPAAVGALLSLLVLLRAEQERREGEREAAQ